MRRSRFSEEQIIGILKEHQAGLGAAELCRKHGISDATFAGKTRWRNQPAVVTKPGNSSSGWSKQGARLTR